MNVIGTGTHYALTIADNWVDGALTTPAYSIQVTTNARIDGKLWQR
jgi:hypothetical protein